MFDFDFSVFDFAYARFVAGRTHTTSFVVGHREGGAQTVESKRAKKKCLYFLKRKKVGKERKWANRREDKKNKQRFL